MMSHGLLLEWIRATLDPVHQCNACPHDHLTRPDLSIDFSNGLSADAFVSMDSWLRSEPGALSWIIDQLAYPPWSNSADGLQAVTR
jgi:hypothetical protein